MSISIAIQIDSKRSTSSDDMGFMNSLHILNQQNYIPPFIFHMNEKKKNATTNNSTCKVYLFWYPQNIV